MMENERECHSVGYICSQGDLGYQLKTIYNSCVNRFKEISLS